MNKRGVGAGLGTMNAGTGGVVEHFFEKSAGLEQGWG